MQGGTSVQLGGESAHGAGDGVGDASFGFSEANHPASRPEALQRLHQSCRAALRG